MWVDGEIISEAAKLIQGAIEDGLPVEDAAECCGFDETETQILQDVLDELNWGDLTTALRVSAGRLPEPEFDDEDDEAEVSA